MNDTLKTVLTNTYQGVVHLHAHTQSWINHVFSSKTLKLCHCVLLWPMLRMYFANNKQLQSLSI